MLGWSFNPIWIFCFHPVFLCKIFSSFLSVPVTFSSFISSLHYLPTVYKYLFSSIFYLTNLVTLVFPHSFGITLPAINISLSIYFYLPIFLPLSFLLFCHCIAFFKYHFSSILYLTNLFTLVSPTLSLLQCLLQTSLFTKIFFFPIFVLLSFPLFRHDIAYFKFLFSSIFYLPIYSLWSSSTLSSIFQHTQLWVFPLFLLFLVLLFVHVLASIFDLHLFETKLLFDSTFEVRENEKTNRRRRRRWRRRRKSFQPKKRSKTRFHCPCLCPDVPKNHCCQCVPPMAASVTRLGDLLHFRQLFNACGKNYFAKIARILGNFCKCAKIFHVSCGIIFGQLLATFNWSHCSYHRDL